MRYRAIRESDLPSLAALWLRCFEEKEEAVKLFFERNLSNTHAYLAEDGGTAIAAVYLIGCQLVGKSAHYLCGAATDPAYRHRGVMTALIEFALRDAARRGDCYSALLPANDGLYRFYARLGYKEGAAVCCKELSTEPSQRRFSSSFDWEELQRRCGGDKFLLWNNKTIRFASKYYACYGVQVLQNERLLALYEQDGDRAEVFYAIYRHLEELKDLLCRRGVRRFLLNGGTGNPDLEDCEPLVCGMLKPLQKDLPELSGVWIGLTLS